MSSGAEMMGQRWLDKPYHTLDFEAKTKYGEKLYRLSLDDGMTCPNRDGTIGRGGCIFCSAGGSGDFAAGPGQSVHEQLCEAKERIRKKLPAGRTCGFIAYFQAYTNTYAPVSVLRKLFTEAINDPEVRILAVATRPDCLPEEVLELLQELNQIKPVWIELGLQTIHENTAKWMRRGYELSVFDESVRNLHSIGIEVIVHLILGLPGEGKKELLETIDHLNRCRIDGVKLQLLHFLEGTDLSKEYMEGRAKPLSFESYEELLFAAIERLDPKIVIHRITGDGPKKLLIGPEWSKNKKVVLNTLLSDMKKQGVFQGREYSEGTI